MSVSGLPGLGTVINVLAILVGAGVGLLIGHRLPQRARDLVTDVLGLVTMVIGALSIVAITSAAMNSALGPGLPLLVVLGALLIGGLLGTALRIGDRLEQLGVWLRRRVVGGSGAAEAVNDAGIESETETAASHRFVEGFVDASLLFCVGPLAILGAVSDGLGRGIDQLLLKSVLDGFASIALAASLGAGVLLAGGAVLVYQGAVTLLGMSLGSVMSEAQIDALSATGGVLLLGIGLRLLTIRAIAVADLLPALVVAPLAVGLLAR